MKKILVAMDSMKGCLDSYHSSLWVAAGVQDTLPEANVGFVPVSDGGEGMMDMVANRQQKAKFCNCVVKGPLGKDIDARWLKMKQDKGYSAYIDFASAAGLTILDVNERNPLQTTSYGVGQLIGNALKSGINEVFVGLGGSATVDGGLGALQALGLRLIDRSGNDLPRPFTGEMLCNLGDIEITEQFRKKINMLNLTLLSDVEAPLTGTNGAACVFGPQKGADSRAVALLESGLENLRKLIHSKMDIDFNDCLGSGAAGGAAGGLMAFAGGKIRKGASTLLDIIGFDSDIEGTDLIITGEGQSDRQTLMGKIPFEIMQRGRKHNVPVWLFAGRVKDKEALIEAGFEKVICINSPDIVAKSGTIGMNPMDSEVASRRLSSAFEQRWKCAATQGKIEK